ncbi:MAG: diphosphomevalonate decarboxylase [Sorangiineae bacterium]|nr:diphosphomevalonate decarboxylase [Polyangiaceae bacterium]MEB2323136.1 diphosphomevalonate decarboxylase [Sorangiineae bacterium]
MSEPIGSARAVACSNIALAKYWGKLDVERNLPAVPSLSLTLAGMQTRTRVTFHAGAGADRGTLDGAPLTDRPLARVTALLDRVRARATLTGWAEIETTNDFPTAAGLASSASGFAALALAASRAAGLELPLEEVSALARASSASAARSLFGGFAALAAGADRAERVAPPDYFPLVMLVAVTQRGQKPVGSTEGMQLTAQTSPYYPAWLDRAPSLFETARRAVLARDLPALGAAMEQSTLMMHASMLAASPAVIYFAPATLAVIERVQRLRAGGARAWFTMDAGPHVKVLVEPDRADDVAAELEAVSGVQRLIRCAPGPDAALVEEGAAW